ncbi:MAG: hypothetical protein ACREUZ_08790, partial [Burkholderiales bacterium]
MPVEPEHDIDRLILELNATPEREPVHVPAGSTTKLEHWLCVLAERHGSDLLLVAGAPPSVRIDGRVGPLAEAP